MLRKYREKSIIEQSLDNASVFTEKVIVVGGYRFDELQVHLSARKNIVVVENTDFPKGMMTSVKAGLPYVSTDRFFISLGDLPLISPDIYREMSGAYFDEVLFPIYCGRRGHPVLLNSSLISHLAQTGDSIKMKSVLSRFQISEMQVNTAGIFEDIDTDSDYQSLLQR